MTVSGTERPPDDSETIVPADVGVERLLRLLWCFRHRDRTRTNDEVEACGYPDVLAEGSTGRRNFFNDRERLTALGVSLEPISDHSGWRVTGQPDDVTLILTPDEREAITQARLLVADDGSPDRQVRPNGHRASANAAVPAGVPILLAAISDGHPVRFTYGGTERFVDACRVVVTPTDRWYLLGLDRTADTAAPERTYRIDRIVGPEIDRTYAAITPRPDASWPLHPVAWGTQTPIIATVRFPHTPLPEWLHMLGGALTTTTNDDGTADATFATSNANAFVRRTLATGGQVIAPPLLVQQARSTLLAHLHAFGSI